MGTAVVEVRAIDADVGANGAVRYRLRPDAQGAHRAFALHAAGALRTAQTFDRDKQTTYQVINYYFLLFFPSFTLLYPVYSWISRT